MMASAIRDVRGGPSQPMIPAQPGAFYMVSHVRSRQATAPSACPRVVDGYLTRTTLVAGNEASASRPSVLSD